MSVPVTEPQGPLTAAVAEIAKLKADAVAEIAKLRADAEAEVAALKAAAGGVPVPPAAAPPAEAGSVPPAPAGPTHLLLLSDGSTIEHTGAIPTLVHIGEDILSVVSAFEKRSQP